MPARKPIAVRLVFAGDAEKDLPETAAGVSIAKQPSSISECAPALTKADDTGRCTSSEDAKASSSRPNSVRALSRDETTPQRDTLDPFEDLISKAQNLSISDSYISYCVCNLYGMKLRIALARIMGQWPFKTIACLTHPGNRSGFCFCKLAVSGWKSSPDERKARIIDRSDSTKEVFKLARVVGHIFEPVPKKDGGVDGQFNACHAEKHLLTDYIRELEKMPEQARLKLMKSQDFSIQVFQNWSNKTDICWDCLSFFDAVAENYALTMDLVALHLVGRSTRFRWVKGKYVADKKDSADARTNDLWLTMQSCLRGLRREGLKSNPAAA